MNNREAIEVIENAIKALVKAKKYICSSDTEENVDKAFLSLCEEQEWYASDFQ